MAGLKQPLDKRQIETAMRSTQSNKQAARYLGVSYPTYKKYALSYKDEAGVSLFAKHKNTSGIGIPKMSLRKNPNSNVGIMDILEGRVNPLFFSFKKIKERIVKEGLLEEKCCRCGFHERRVLDLKVPIILSYKDGNKKNIKFDNIEFLCYNCYFLSIGDIFEKKQLEAMEDYAVRSAKAIDLDLDDGLNEMVKKELNIDNKYIDEDFTKRPDDFGDDLIAFNKLRR